MSKAKNVLLISDGDRVSAIPAEIYNKYELAGDKLAHAKTALSKSSGDVEGQSQNVNAEWYCENASGTCAADGSYIPFPPSPRRKGPAGSISK